ncbi:MAG: bacillithiol biosynthesis cysteine-adding enzyme BshC [Reichenbachiella sp.]
MQVTKIDLKDTGSFSQFFLDYLDKKEELKPFFGLSPDIENFEEQIRKKQFSDEKREVLGQVLSDQYQDLTISASLEENLSLLSKPNTFTITTGHQLNIFTGPLYFIYKIATAINACKSLKEKYPSYNFVPVYWMASEDHDFNEISYFNLFGKKHQWECDEKGAVGRMSTKGIHKILDDLSEHIPLFDKAYRENENLSDAVRCYVNELFGEHGLVAIDADEPRLKKQLSPVIKDDLINHTGHNAVKKTNTALESLGYRTQIFPREINFFYLDKNQRERIVLENGQYQVLNSDLKFSKEQIIELAEKSPEKFSPNVVLRPLYEEIILPNLAYIGGPAEVIYWLQLGDVFKQYDTVFPVLLPRNFGLYINGAAQKKLKKFELSDEELFKTENDLQADYLSKHGQSEMNLNGELDDLKKVYNELEKKALVVDGSLKGFIAAEHAKALKGLENVEKRLKKSEEQKHETALNQLATLKGKLFPGGGLQERHDNFLNFYINNPKFIDELLENMDAFDIRMHVLCD